MGASSAHFQGLSFRLPLEMACMSDPSFSAQGVIDCILERLEGFTGGVEAHGDRTLPALRLKE